MRNAAVIAAVILAIVLGIGLLYIVRSQTPSTAIASPSPTASATSTPTPTATSTVAASTAAPSPSPSGPATSAEQLADRLADALEQSDFERLRALIDPAGFFYQLYQTGGSQPITADQ